MRPTTGTMPSVYSDFSVNGAGIAFSYVFFNPCDVAGATCAEESEQEWDVTIDFSTDLRSWWTIEGSTIDP